MVQTQLSLMLICLLIIQVLFVLHVTCSGENEIDSPFNSSHILILDSATRNQSQNVIEIENENKGKEIKNKRNSTRPPSLLFPNSEEFERIVRAKSFETIPGLRPDDDFENWIPPADLQRDVPFYLAGFSYNNEPIWVIELGKWKVEKYLNGNWRARKELEKYFRYSVYLEIRSEAIKSTEENPINHNILMYDLEGLRLEDMLNPKYVQYMTRLVSTLRRNYEKKVSKLIVINLNPLSEVLINLVRHFFSNIWGRLEVYGTNKALWATELLKTFPPDQLPEWYGGKTGFKPVYVVG